MKQIKLTLEAANYHPVLYVVRFNLVGLQECVYRLKFYKEYDYWANNSGDFCICPEDDRVLGWNISDGCVDFISDDLNEAREVLNTLKIYRNFLRRNI